MSDQDLDKLFQNKLEEFQKAPTPGAWEKIQEEIGHKKAALPWMRIAAAILVLMTAGAIAWLSISPRSQPEVAEVSSAGSDETVTTESVKPGENQALLQEKDTAIQPVRRQEGMKEQNNALAENSKKKTEASVNDKRSEPAEDQPVMTDNITTITRETIAAVTEQPVEPERSEVNGEPAKLEPNGQTITFSIDEFSDAEVGIAQVGEQDVENEEGLKKIWGLLRQVKEPEAGLGELRDLKNNILAFGKEKRESD